MHGQRFQRLPPSFCTFGSQKTSSHLPRCNPNASTVLPQMPVLLPNTRTQVRKQAWRAFTHNKMRTDSRFTRCLQFGSGNFECSLLALAHGLLD
eukprot:2511717-Amphidinium_carterae.1